MPLFLIYDYQGEICDVERTPKQAIAQALEQARETGQWADVVRPSTHSRRRVYPSGQVTTVPREMRREET